MRFLESLLLVCLAIYLAQLVIASLIIATLMLFLWCLYKRPREALVLGFGMLALALLSTPNGLAVIAAMVAGILCWATVKWVKGRRQRTEQCGRPLLPKP